MEQLNFDNGMRQFQAGGGILRFNPTDPNLYARFLEAVDRIQTLQTQLTAREDQPLELLTQADKAVKEILQELFGPESDIPGVFRGVNLMALDSRGKTVLANFLEAVEPVLTQGIRECAAREAAHGAVQPA